MMWFKTTVFIFLISGLEAERKSKTGDLTNSTVFAVDDSDSGFITLVEANNFACGKNFCNTSYGNYSTRMLCLDCKPCNCDDLCYGFGDCCADKGGTVKQLSWPWTCVKRMVKPLRTEFTLMVKSCDDNDDDVQNADKCIFANELNIDEATPVTDPRTNVTFRNRFCAECNSVDNFEPWTFNVQCLYGAITTNVNSREELWEEVLKSNQCTVEDVPPVWAPVRECYGNYVQTCDKNSTSYNDTLERLCFSSYGSAVTDYEKIYQNIFCALCNGLVLDRDCKEIFLVKSGFDDMVGINVLIDLNPRPITRKEQTLSQLAKDEQCHRNESFDPVTKQCLLIKCSSRRYLSNGVCQPLFITTKAMGYELLLDVQLSTIVNVSTLAAVTTRYASAVRKRLDPYQPLVDFRVEYRGILVNHNARNSESIDFVQATGFEPRILLLSDGECNLTEMEQTLRTFDNYSEQFVFGNKTVNLLTNGVSCPSALERYVGGTFEKLPEAREQNGTACIENVCTFEYVELFRTLDCPHVELNLSESNHSYNRQNSTLTFLNHTVVLNKSSHIYCDGILQLCTNILPDIQKQLALLQNITGNRALGLVSVVCISLSLVSLFVTFVIFCIIPQLRTLPGKNTMALMFHLFCAQLLFQAGINATDSVILCQVMGILIHYFWLTTFSWMAVSAYHMCVTFSNLSLTSSTGKEQIKILIKYNVVCNILSLAFVSGCIGYHVEISEKKNLGYGGDICFLQEPVDIGIFFAAPLGVILLFNTVCFVKTIISIRTVPDMGSVKNKANKTHVDIYFRLSVLLGFTWVFGFVASALQNDVFWYIFVILNGLQGVFISVAYCGNKRTLDLMKLWITNNCIGETSSARAHSHETQTTSF